MKLTDLDTKQAPVKALKANFDLDFDPSELSKAQTFEMISQITSLIKEAKKSPDFYKKSTEEAYLKMLFVSQSLYEHYRSFKTAKIILENQEVEKSQVILAAQDMIDSIQKMLEETNDMLVKELPALADSMQSELGPSESSAFNQAATEALTALNQCLSQSKQTMLAAMNQVTGQGGEGFAPAGGGEMAVTDVAAAAGPGGEEVEGEVVSVEPTEAPIEAPPEVEVPDREAGKVGREKR